ncbi:MAG: TerB family tellurite resistance protein [Desulfosalsimonadaceae bacterium]
MGWLGKAVGGTIGFAMGGPLGAVAGAVFGHMFDGGSEKPRMLSGPSAGSEAEQAQMAFFVASFSMLAKLARADGQVTEAEMDSVRQFMSGDLRLNPQSRQAAEQIFQTALKTPQSFEDFAGQFYQHFASQPQLLELMIDILLRVSVADGDLHEAEERLILSAVRIFRMSDADYQKIKSRHIKDTERFYAVLGLSSSDSDEEIKKKYRQLVRDYHPDAIAGKGLPEEFVNFAHEKFREIQEAYEAIARERGL